MGRLSAVPFKYEPRLKSLRVVILEQQPGELRYAIDAELKGIGMVRYDTEISRHAFSCPGRQVCG